MLLVLVKNVLAAVALAAAVVGAEAVAVVIAVEAVEAAAVARIAVAGNGKPFPSLTFPLQPTR